ncbi:MAG: 6-carboxytetrahydropterin synthase [Aquificota bacterium]|nr:MAG: 6-carboxytetrahydropterin synthase [Aquificota bacterium]
MPWTVVVKKQFNWAHYLTNYHGAPEPLHGHTWTVELHIYADRVDEGGMGYDFVEVKKFLEELLPDYRLLNELVDFSPSAENMAKWIYQKVKQRYPTLKKVVVWETPEGGAEYYEEGL